MPINEEWYVWLHEQQRRNNLVMSFATLIIAITGILQIIKLYAIFTPDWVFVIFGAIIVFSLGVIVSTLFERH